ncbi:hypothetical protein Tco_0316133 [Tanacetum coccineum]
MGLPHHNPTPQGAAVVAVPSSDRHHDGASGARCGSRGDVGVVVSKVVSWRWVGGDDGRRLGWCRLWDGGCGDGDEGGVNDGEVIMMVAEMKARDLTGKVFRWPENAIEAPDFEGEDGRVFRVLCV